VLWPFLWIWAMAYQPNRGWGFAHNPNEPATPAQLEEMKRRLAAVEAKLGIRDG
jgi:hypothetical protein